MTFNVLKLLEEEGYIEDGEDNIVHAEKAFFAARVMRWIRDQVQADPDFNLPAYLTMLMYYKLGTADLKFKEDGTGLMYQMKPDKEMDELVNSIIKSSNEIRRGKGIWQGLTQEQWIKQHDNLTKKVNTFQKEGTLENMDQYFGINAEKAFVEAQAKVSAGPGKSINISDDAVAADFTNFIKKTDPEGYKKFEQTVELSNAKLGKGRKPNAEGGRVSMVKGGLPNILKL